MHYNNDIMSWELYVRIGLFILALTTVGFLETVFPRRRLSVSKKVRWFNNLAIHTINSLTLRLLFPILPVGFAVVCAERGWGLLNQYPLSPGLALLIGIASLDFVIYLQHVLFHKVALFWRLHQVHHMDLDIDITSGVRFHPLEIILSALIKMTVIVLLGPPAMAVLIFEILLNVMAMFNHGNMRIPTGIDQVLRWFVVTPDMHRVHHSVILREGNSNFGFNIPWWDRIFGTYTAQPAAGHDGMTIGIRAFLSEENATLYRMLTVPFTARKDR